MHKRVFTHSGPLAATRYRQKIGNSSHSLAPLHYMPSLLDSLFERSEPCSGAGPELGLKSKFVMLCQELRSLGKNLLLIDGSKFKADAVWMRVVRSMVEAGDSLISKRVSGGHLLR
ncbi:hypothetical protein EMIT0P176_20279 [Pseudomonas sp. IT-P176]